MGGPPTQASLHLTDGEIEALLAEGIIFVIQVPGLCEAGYNRAPGYVAGSGGVSWSSPTSPSCHH